MMKKLLKIVLRELGTAAATELGTAVAHHTVKLYIKPTMKKWAEKLGIELPVKDKAKVKDIDDTEEDDDECEDEASNRFRSGGNHRGK